MAAGQTQGPGGFHGHEQVSWQLGSGRSGDASQLYWTNPVAGTIWAANLDGSNPHALFANQDASFGVAVGP